MYAYIDTSVLLRILLRHQNRYSDIVRFTRLYSLELIETECLRVFHRLRLEGSLNDSDLADHLEEMYEFLQGLYVIPLTRSILKQAGQAFSTVLGTLDALHLSAAIELFRNDAQVSRILLTHDVQLGRAAKSLGMEVQGIVNP